jgi:hypothetical protein
MQSFSLITRTLNKKENTIIIQVEVNGISIEKLVYFNKNETNLSVIRTLLLSKVNKLVHILEELTHVHYMGLQMNNQAFTNLMKYQKNEFWI